MNEVAGGYRRSRRRQIDSKNIIDLPFLESQKHDRATILAFLIFVSLSFSEKLRMTQHLNTPGPSSSSLSSSSSSSSSSSLAYSLSDFTVREFLCEKQWLTMLVESPRPRLSGALFVWMRCLISLREPQ